MFDVLLRCCQSVVLLKVGVQNALILINVRALVIELGDRLVIIRRHLHHLVHIGMQELHLGAGSFLLRLVNVRLQAHKYLRVGQT